VQVCPVECIPVNPAHVETREQLQRKYEALQAQTQAAGQPRARRLSPVQGAGLPGRWPAAVAGRIGFFLAGALAGRA
jgi:hypothetical protein